MGVYEIVGKSGKSYIGEINNLERLLLDLKPTDSIRIRKCVMVDPSADDGTTLHLHIRRNVTEELYNSYKETDNDLKPDRNILFHAIESYRELKSSSDT